MITENYYRKLSQEIMTVNYDRKLSASISMTRKILAYPKIYILTYFHDEVSTYTEFL